MKQITSIESFYFRLEGCFSSIQEVSFDKNTVTYITMSTPFDEGMKYEKEISSESKEIFITKLNKLKLIKWKNRYLNYNVLDGEDWEIDITFNKSTRKKVVGSNNYPEDNSTLIGRTEIFNELLLAINDMIQVPDFFN